jgi:hypothetical protein
VQTSRPGLQAGQKLVCTGWVLGNQAHGATTQVEIHQFLEEDSGQGRKTSCLAKGWCQGPLRREENQLPGKGLVPGASEEGGKPVAWQRAGARGL